MKILYLHQYFATLTSSTAVRSYVFAKHFVEQGHEVVMVTTDSFMKSETAYKEEQGIKYYNIDGIDVRAVASEYSNYMGKSARIKEFLNFMRQAEKVGKQVEDVDIIFATSTPLTIGIPAMRLSKKLKVPFVFEVRDLWPEAPIEMGYIRSKPMIYALKKLEKRIYKKASYIISLSPGMEKGVLDTGISKEKVSVISNLADTELFQDKNIDESLREEIIQKYELQNKFIMTHIGAMGEANGLEYLLRGADILQKQGNDDIAILIVGDGKTKPGLEAYAKEHNLKNVIFIGGVQKKQVPTYLSLANITITSFLPKPILATNSPNKFFDALALGKPIIVNSAGWTKDIVVDNEIGFYVDATKPEELANVLASLTNKKEELSGLKSKIRAVAEENFQADILAEKAMKILIQVNERSH